jgi:hypothetical protein
MFPDFLVCLQAPRKTSTIGRGLSAPDISLTLALCRNQDDPAFLTMRYPTFRAARKR